MARTILAVVSVIAAIAVGLLLMRPRVILEPHVIALVRHAEKADKTPDTALSPEGEQRAARLATVLGGLGVRAIYTSEFKRTAQTAAPLATKLGITPTVVPAQNSLDLVQKLRREHPRDTTLIVGHADTLPDIIRRLGILEPVEISGNEFGDLFLVVVHPSSSPILLHLHY